jgi:hypothetical protein
VDIAVGDTIQTLTSASEFKAGAQGVVHSLGVKYPGDVRVKFPHEKELIWVYSGEYEKVEKEAIAKV